MGVFGEYTGPGNIRFDEIDEFAQGISKILNYGGMMHLRKVDMYDKQILLLDPVVITKGKDVDFIFNYFEDASWENAGYIYGAQRFYTIKIGSAEFCDVVTAVRCLYEIYDQGIGLAKVDGEIVDSSYCIGWINHLLGKNYSISKRFWLWEQAETIAMERLEYNDTFFDGGDLLALIPKELRVGMGGTEFTDLLYIINGTDSLIEEDVIPGSYPHEVMKCREEIITIVDQMGNEIAYQKILELLKKSYQERESESDKELQYLARMSLYLPARTLLYLLLEQIGKEFWHEWAVCRDIVYHDEQEKQYATDDLMSYREAVRNSPIEGIKTADYLKQDGPLTFWGTPKELKGKPNYYLSDADRLYWWDGTDEVVIDQATEEWLADIANRHIEIANLMHDEDGDKELFLKKMIDLLYDIEARYRRVFAFQDMFYEFITNGDKKDYRAAIDLLEALYEENAEEGKVIEVVKNWHLASKNVICNSGRMCIRRYLSLLANKKLRKKYLNY